MPSDELRLPHPVDSALAPDPGPFLLVCEHASNALPAALGDLGLTPAQRSAHIAWDPGALALTRALAARLKATAVTATLSRLVYDLNRAPDAPNAVSARSEMHDIPGNRGLGPAQIAARARAVYLPFHAAVTAQIIERMARGLDTVLITIHSFTPTWFGTPRKVELGVLHDADDRLARPLLAALQADGRHLCAMNAPYSAADHVTHTLRVHALPYGLPNVMLEIRNDLLATAAGVEAMADILSGALTGALQTVRGVTSAEMAPVR